ncbi:hypothetical protein EJ08DRAFT_694582 [Tothia fuscella]|uniref:VOC domain-containing protein n=1 Tax=Tothia fuscella TaxID=1048955 RepID=A0A9P4NX33_9PEZI|nr:hypothetical protein EJ08DRAFT_694582 [Tothia fuscella]
MYFSTLVSTLLAIAVAARADDSSTAAVRQSSLVAIGVGVKNMTASTKFYEDVFGMKYTQTIRTPQFDEMILSFPSPATGATLVLMEWKDTRNVTRLPIKLVFYVDDVKAQVEKLRSAGMKITLEPGAGKLGNQTLPTAFATDPDGTMLEINPFAFSI